MQLKKGMVVRSKQGHDKGRFFVVTEVAPRSVIITDGGLHRSGKPKYKNPIHLAPTRTVLHAQALASDSEIRQILAGFNSRVALPKEVM